MASGGVVSLEFIIYLCRCSEGFFKAVSSHQGRGSVHLVKVQDLLGNVNIRRCVVKLLFCKLCTEHMAQLIQGTRLQGCRVEQGCGLIFHIRTHIVPLLWHFIFFKIDLVGDSFFVFHHTHPFCNCGGHGKIKKPAPFL